jgi:hypothetical protein
VIANSQEFVIICRRGPSLLLAPWPPIPEVKSCLNWKLKSRLLGPPAFSRIEVVLPSIVGFSAYFFSFLIFLSSSYAQKWKIFI